MSDLVAAVVEQAKSLPEDCSIFTNCGKGETQERPVKSAERKLTRVPFTVSRLMEFCTRRELVNQTGHDVYEWPLVVLKELVDNAIDACEEAEIAPVVSVAVKGDSIVITDNGPGIPAKTIEGILDYSIRVSSREAYCSPTRGAQGNALKTILPMGYVLNEHRGEDAVGKTVIETNGVAHDILLTVDHIKQEPKIAHLARASSVVNGTRITVNLSTRKNDDGYEDNVVEGSEGDFLRLAESYAWLNPHLTLRVSWNGKCKIDIKASNPSWTKWLPSQPTSAHWYDASRLRRYMAAHISHRGSITVREFISEFRGMTSTAKQKAVLVETGASHRTLHNFFGLHKANTENIAALLAALKRHTKPVHAADLGIIGREHFRRLMEAAGADPATFTYNRTLGETGGLPRVIEFAFGIHRAGLGNAGRGPSRKVTTGANFSPGIKNPFRYLGRSGVASTVCSPKFERTIISRPSQRCISLARGSPTPTAVSRRSSSMAT
jgi:DNA topoisomerase VI subunit B